MEEETRPTATENAILRGTYDPGSITPRGDNGTEPLAQWQARAALDALRSLPVEERPKRSVS